MCIFIVMVSCVEFLILSQRAIAKDCGPVIAKCKKPAAATLLLILLPLLLNCTAAHAQSVARALSLKQNDTAFEIPVTLPNETDQHSELTKASRAIAALKRLQNDVLIYRSLGEFEANGKMARVSYETFQNELQEVLDEVEPILSRLPQSKLKMEISNALYSFRDGGFWWRKIQRPRVVSISTMNFCSTTTTSDNEVLMSTVPYTVVIHWRQANRYLDRVERLISAPK